MSLSPPERPATKTRDRETLALMVSRRSGLRASTESFRKLCEANPELRLERSAGGEVIAMAPAGADSGMRNAGLTAQLWVWNRGANLGYAFDSSAGFTLPDGAVRSPDASWIARDRWLAVPPEARKGIAPICPDFVVEIAPSTDSGRELRKKMLEYIDQGARLGWLLDPSTGLVEVHRPGQGVESLRRPASLSGEDVLPGFVLDLKGILFD